MNFNSPILVEEEHDMNSCSKQTKEVWETRYLIEAVRAVTFPGVCYFLHEFAAPDVLD